MTYREIESEFLKMYIEAGTHTLTEALQVCKEHAAAADYERLLEAWGGKPCNSGYDRPDYDTLAAYIQAGFHLFPCIEAQGKYVYINHRTGDLKLYGSEADRAAGIRHGITDLQELKRLCEGGTITDTAGRKHKINLFRIFPYDIEPPFIVIDIDRHAGKENGLLKWLEFCETLPKSLQNEYADIDRHPCHILTPSGGYHLYFKLHYPPPQKTVNIAPCIEAKGGKQPINAAGSIKGNRIYKLYGSLANIKPLPYDIYKLICPPQPKAQAGTLARITRSGAAAGTQGGTAWNRTLDGIINKAREKHGDEKPHNFITWICKYISEAKKDGIYFARQEIEAAIYALPELAAHDKADTAAVIRSYDI